MMEDRLKTAGGEGRFHSPRAPTHDRGVRMNYACVRSELARADYCPTSYYKSLSLQRSKRSQGSDARAPPEIIPLRLPINRAEALSNSQRVDCGRLLALFSGLGEPAWWLGRPIEYQRTHG